ncbi:restriction endonuclease [Methylacidiphilum caldifontis]|uniref:restriction endonuclease n=1 Tax=Methylacidiphilum caldifontis TaxID=2795386 RepID=UPI001A90406E|nr:restriction endonuclease [Methylacidiphilum caldifontis]QSR89190.1 restriction endonuclease [Methylacidiphilum caldifontis]
MPIPDFLSVFLPLLRFAGDRQEHTIREAIEMLSSEFGLTEAEKKQLLPSGTQPIFDNRVSWARTYMTKAGLLDSPRRGYFRITQRGLDALEKNPPKIDISFLSQYPEFVEFRSHRKPAKDQSSEPISETPTEALEAAYQKVRQNLADELLQTVKSCSPVFFERLVIDLLVKMGYGGSRQDAGSALGRSGDEGIDGIIKEDKLGLDVIYIQAKRWNGMVGRPEIQKFAGALHGQRAKKGIFITTSSFSKEAEEYASHIDLKIILIDGEKLAHLMIDYNVGVLPVSAYEIKKIDSDYFTE